MKDRVCVDECPEDHVPEGGEEGAGAEAVYALFYLNIYSV